MSLAVVYLKDCFHTPLVLSGLGLHIFKCLLNRWFSFISNSLFLEPTPWCFTGPGAPSQTVTCSRRRVPSNAEIYKSRENLWKCQKCHSHICGLPVVLRWCLKALPLPLCVQLQTALSIDRAVFSVCLEVGAVWDAVWENVLTAVF